MADSSSDLPQQQISAPPQQQSQQPARKSNNNNTNNYRGINPNNPNYNGTNTQYGLPDYGNTNYGQDCSSVNMDRKDLIDSALIAALRDPKERDALLHLENALVQFMHSDAGWVEVSGPYNSQFWTGGDPPPPSLKQRERHSSFQRCVLHRLADRFWIIREPGQMLGALRLIKVPNSAIPPVLLNDLTEMEVSEALSRINMSFSTPTPPFPPFATLLPAVVTEPTTTMKIMKRTNSTTGTSLDDDDYNNSNNNKLGIMNGNGTNSNTTTNRTPTSISDKEKAYAAARARIFNEQPTTMDAATTVVLFNNNNSNNHQHQARTKLTAEAPEFVPKQHSFQPDEEEEVEEEPS